MSNSDVRASMLRTPAARPPQLWRWVLLVGVISGILGMHVLTAGDMTAGHGRLPAAGHSAQVQATNTRDMAGMTDQSSPVAATVLVGTGAAAGEWLSEVGGGMSHDEMAGCILFLVVSGAALLLALLIGRNKRPWGRIGIRGGGAGSGGVMRRGPPGPGLPRLALCVDRI